MAKTSNLCIDSHFTSTNALIMEKFGFQEERDGLPLQVLMFPEMAKCSVPMFGPGGNLGKPGYSIGHIKEK